MYKQKTARRSVLFAPIMYLNTAPENISQIPQSTFDEIIKKDVEIKVPLKTGLTD